MSWQRDSGGHTTWKITASKDGRRVLGGADKAGARRLRKFTEASSGKIPLRHTLVEEEYRVTEGGRQ